VTTVLLVDDDAPMRKMIRWMLLRRGFQVFDAAGGAQALEIAARQAIDVLVTDVVMDKMDGTDLAHTIWERTPDFPVVFISGMPMNLEKEKERNPRCAFLPKPFHSADLAAAIEEVTRRQP
jgi:CheY-like chemotaxis protein